MACVGLVVFENEVKTKLHNIIMLLLVDDGDDDDSEVGAKWRI